MPDNKNNNKDDMNMYGVNNNNSSSLSISSIEDEAFLYMQAILKKYRINQDMKNDESDGYYVIISQVIPNLYRGDALGLQSKIPYDVKILDNMIYSLVLIFNETHLSNKEKFKFAQPLTNSYGKIIVIIDYSKKVININIPYNNTIFHFVVITLVNLEDLVQSNKCEFS
jgi:hypothetical protein